MPGNCDLIRTRYSLLATAPALCLPEPLILACKHAAAVPTSPLPLWTNVGRAHDRDRTGDLFLTKEVLYRLSYVGTEVERETGLEPATLSLEG
jgi:hypothetical protein